MKTFKKTFSMPAFAILVTLSLIAGCSASKPSDTKSSASDVKSKTEIEQAALEAEQAEEEFARIKGGDQKAPHGKVKKSKKSESRKTASVQAASAKQKGKEAGDYVVQVGTFKIEENATKLAEKLKAAGLPVMTKKIERSNGVVLYSVRIEPTPNKEEAEKFVASVKSATGENAVIVNITH